MSGDGPVSGTVVHYDPNRGFGFLAPESGGADVFVHINDLDVDESALKPGARVEFEVEDTDRGSKAVNVSVTGAAPASSPTGGRDRRDDHRDRPQRDRNEHRGDHRDRDRRPRPARGGDGPSDAAGLSDELTELLLDASGTLTASQIIAIRRRVIDFAVARGWVTD
ncbi:cold-shock protein [uncultured Williamsia sp.]|uniref:cold-shock protein n=1 Tax=uncultured Williamsia sp. TaxID=259311 RepID=UPI00261B8204|nr:cold shock domain-containing protein [uncultured Williamsia sp.]